MRKIRKKRKKSEVLEILKYVQELDKLAKIFKSGGLDIQEAEKRLRIMEERFKKFE